MLPGVRVLVLDTVIPFETTGRITKDQLVWVDTLSAGGRTTVLVMGHHHPWSPDSAKRSLTYFGLNPDDSEGLVDIIARRPSILGYFAGHTHRNRVRHFTATGAIPYVEVACVKDFPGTWAEYRVFEDGVIQVHRRISTPEALAWTDDTTRCSLASTRSTRSARSGIDVSRWKGEHDRHPHTFNEATAGFIDALLAVPDDAWSAPGLGVWTVQELVGHARPRSSRSSSTSTPRSSRSRSTRRSTLARGLHRRVEGDARRRRGTWTPSRCRARRRSRRCDPSGRTTRHASRRERARRCGLQLSLRRHAPHRLSAHPHRRADRPHTRHRRRPRPPRRPFTATRSR